MSKKFKTIQSLQKYFNDNIDLIMNEQKETAGKIQEILSENNIISSIEKTVKIHNEFKKVISLNNSNNNFEIEINPHLTDLPNAYKYYKNYILLVLSFSDGIITYKFKRGQYKLNAPKKIEFNNQFAGIKAFSDLELTLINHLINKELI